MKDVEIIGMLKSYVQKSLVGVGALKGAPCKIQSITDGDGFHTVKFEWTDDAGTSHTSDMIVNDGSDIDSITQDGATITVTLSDGTAHEFIVPTVQGPKGDKGDKGDTGVGVPEGGTAGQVLVKKSSTNYDTEWGTPAGGGDMLKSVYDTDNDGKVDSAENADTVDGHTVAKDVPADAKFTDTVYDDTEIRGEIPSKTSDLTNDSGFITKAVNDLVNYYLKSETYSKTEVDDIVTAIKNSRFEVVATLPTTNIETNVIYLVPKSPSQTSNVKDEYINLDGTTAGWEKIGDTEIDLSDYVTTQALNTALAAYTTTDDLTTLLAGKQDTLTFDNAPTENSNNPVKSGGVYSANNAIYSVMGINGAKNLVDVPDFMLIKDTDRTKSVDIRALPKRPYICSFDVTDASDPINGQVQVFDINNYAVGGVTITENGHYSFPVSADHDDYRNIYAYINSTLADGTTMKISNFMIRLASDTDSTYQPYAKTNRELTLQKFSYKDNGVLGAKNHIRMPYYRSSGYVSSDLTYTYDSDGIITINGTKGSGVSFFDLVDSNKAPLDNLKVNVSYILSGGIGENEYLALIFYDDSDNPLESVISRTSGVAFTVPSGATKHILYYRLSEAKTYTNQKLYPMIRLATDTDPTYQPYAMTNQQLTKDTTGLLDNLEVNGAVNILPIDLNFIKANNSAASWSGNACTHNGVTYTIDEANGKITVNGTASARSTLQVYNAIAGDLFKKSFKYLAKVFNNNFNTVNGYFMQLYMTNRPYTLIDAFTGNNFVVPDSFFDNNIRVSIQIVVEDGKSVDNQVITPLIAFGNYTGGFEKYAKSNRELTEELTVKSREITRLVSFSSLTSYRVKKYGKVVELYFAGTLSEAVNIWTDFLTVPEGFRPSHYVQIVSFNTYSSCKNLQLAPSGGIQSASNLSSGDFIRFSATYIID